MKRLLCAILFLAACRGPAGPSGAAGSDGTNGSDGSNGTNGSDGSNGATGAQGPAGAPGLTGATGPTGPMGGPAYVRTIIVSPKPGDAAASGAALLAAVAGISDASATNPYLVSIEPGDYDIGSTALTIKDFVDVAGSGPDVTTIVSVASSAYGGAGAITLGNGELRELTVRATSGASYASVVFANGKTVSLRDVAISLPSAADGLCGIGLYNTIARLEGVTLTGSAAANQSFTGILSGNGGSFDADDLRASLDCTGGLSCTGVALSTNSSATVRESTIEVTSNLAGTALFVEAGNVALENTTVTTTGSSTYALLGGDEGKLTLSIKGSTLLSPYEALGLGDGSGAGVTVDIADSEVAGGVLDSTDGGNTPVAFHCVGDYDAQLNPLPAACK